MAIFACIINYLRYLNMEAFIIIVVFLVLFLFFGASLHRENVAREREAVVKKKLDEYLQYGDIYEYEKIYATRMKEAESLLEAKREQAECWEAIRDRIRKETEQLRKEKEEEKIRLDKIISERLSELNKIISESTQETSERIKQIDYNPIVDDQDFIVREEMKIKLSEAVKNLYSYENFSKDYIYIGRNHDETVLNMSIKLSSLLMLYADTLIEKKVGNPYKKGLGKSLEILDQCVKTLWKRYGLYTISPKNPYVEKKREYIKCVYEIEQYKAQKSEERKELLRVQREELAAQRELEREIKKAKKDEQEAQTKLEKRRIELAMAKSDAEIARLNEQIAKLQAAIAEAQQREERALTMAQMGRAGHVYVISNIGSFGEGVYKIGMTRRAEPMDRVVELGDASVPFPFDVHAMIWTEDAPGLETSLHRAFEDRRLNAINGRKEFFRVTIDEVRAELDKMGITYHMIENPLASQYRDTLAMREVS